MKFFPGVLLLALPVVCSAQYHGGVNDGITQGSSSNLNPTPSIYIGGVNDGHSSTLSTGQNATPDIFKGGINDGHAIASASGLNATPNVYLGGINDGVAISQASSQNINPQIYLGGINDGVASMQSASQNPTPDIYLGGANDGHAIGTSGAQNATPSIYTGGPNDGFAIAIAVGQNSSFPLPIQLLSFGGSWFNEDAILAWKTTNETGINHFELERSESGNNFQFLGRIEPGSDPMGNEYRYPDQGAYLLPTDVLYYRLKLVDQQGKSRYSAIVRLSKGLNTPVIAAYPNPTRGHLTLALLQVKDFATYQYQIRDNDGRLLQHGSISASHTSFDLSQYAAASYHLSIFKAGQLVQHFTIILTP